MKVKGVAKFKNGCEDLNKIALIVVATLEQGVKIGGLNAELAPS